MKIKTTVEIHCDSGFYCMKNGHTKCCRIGKLENGKPYCEVFYQFLDTDSNGNILKCEACLLAERKARKGM